MDRYIQRISYLRKAELEEGNAINEHSVIDFLDIAQGIEIEPQIGIASEGKIEAQWGDMDKRCVIGIFNGDHTVRYADRVQGADSQPFNYEGGETSEREFYRRLVRLANETLE